MSERGLHILTSSVFGRKGSLDVGTPRKTAISLDYSSPPPHLSRRLELPPATLDEDRPRKIAPVPDITD